MTNQERDNLTEEVTPQMFRAGLEVLWAYDAQADSSSELVAEIFQEMRRALRQSQRPD